MTNEQLATRLLKWADARDRRGGLDSSLLRDAAARLQAFPFLGDAGTGNTTRWLATVHLHDGYRAEPEARAEMIAATVEDLRGFASPGPEYEVGEHVHFPFTVEANERDTREYAEEIRDMLRGRFGYDYELKQKEDA